MSFSTKWYGWVPDRPDQRDTNFRYRLGITGRAMATTLPLSVDLRTTGFLPPVFDQGALGSCTANALAEMFFFVDKMQTGLAFLPSRLFIYYNERVIENSVSEDAGASLRDGIKTIVDQGACLEFLWPYRPELFATKPPDICYTDAKFHEATVYRSVNQVATDIQGCLAEGFPVCCGISVYDSFESDAVAASGMVPMPAISETLQGGHATLLVGYVDEDYIGMNSWGPDWGMKGFYRIPKAYIHNADLASDFWMVHTLTSPAASLPPTGPSPLAHHHHHHHHHPNGTNAS